MFAGDHVNSHCIFQRLKQKVTRGHSGTSFGLLTLCSLVQDWYDRLTWTALRVEAPVVHCSSVGSGEPFSGEALDPSFREGQWYVCLWLPSGYLSDVGLLCIKTAKDPNPMLLLSQFSNYCTVRPQKTSFLLAKPLIPLGPQSCLLLGYCW